MDPISKVIQDLSTPDVKPTDYIDDEGFLCCGLCHERKQMDIGVPESLRPSGIMRVPRHCLCDRTRIEAEEKARKEQEFRTHMERLQRDGITDPAYLKHTFDQDDRRSPDVSDVCQRGSMSILWTKEVERLCHFI